MGKSIIITEKPSVASTFADVLGVPKNSAAQGFYESNNYIITWSYGHLVTLFMPEDYDIAYKKWRLQDLPLLPDTYKYKVINDDGIKKQFATIKKLYHRPDADTLYLAGDSGREGLYIQYLICQLAGVAPHIRQKVIWINSYTDQEIKNGIASAQDRSSYDAMADSGYMRAIEDFATGINLSRAITLKYGRQVQDALGLNHLVIAVGRVMSAVLGMVVSKERQIRAFKKDPFYKIQLRTVQGIEAEWKAIDGSMYFESPLLYKENGFKERKHAEELKTSLQGKKATVHHIEHKEEKKYAPYLFNLAELQSECSKILKIPPDQTLACVQSLYEKKLTTYPRTDARVLTTAVANDISDVLHGLGQLPSVAKTVQDILTSAAYKKIAGSRYTDDSKVTDHYAIIPTGRTIEAEHLSDLEAKVYNLIVSRFLAIFLPPAIIASTSIIFAIDDEYFFSTEKTLKDKGFLIIYDTGSDNEANPALSDNGNNHMEILQRMHMGDIVDVSLDIKEGKTTPPKRYSSGSIILAMENAGNLIEEEDLRAKIKGSGIGTSATRAEVLKKLTRIGYLSVQSKSQVITPTTLGEIIFDVLFFTAKQTLSPKMTASWEMALEKIGSGEITRTSYQQTLNQYITTEVQNILNNDISDQLQQILKPIQQSAAGKTVTLTCPICGQPVFKSKKGHYVCRNFKAEQNPCDFYLYGSFANKTLSATQVTWFLSHPGEKSAYIKGFKRKDGSSFGACLTLKKCEDGTFKLDFYKDNTPESPFEPTKVACPYCNSPMSASNLHMRCLDCDFTLNLTLYGRICTPEELDVAFRNGTTGKLMGFYSEKKHRHFPAKLVFQKEHKNTSKNFSLSF